MIKTSDSHPIYIDFVPFIWTEKENRLGITLAPGKFQPTGLTGYWKRDLQKDLHRIKHEYKIETLVSLLEKDEAQRLKISNELEEAEKLGIKTFNFPVVDTTIPENQELFKKLVKEIVEGHLLKGRNVVVHCMGGLGRAPTFAASCLICAGIKVEEAIQLVRKGRPDSLTLVNQQQFLKKLSFS